jgi:hypothetical protein
MAVAAPMHQPPRTFFSSSAEPTISSYLTLLISERRLLRRLRGEFLPIEQPSKTAIQLLLVPIGTNAIVDIAVGGMIAISVPK